MDAVDLFLTVAWNLGLPGLVIGWLAASRASGAVAVTFDAAAALLWTVGIGLTALWLALPQWLVVFLLLAFVAALRVRVRRGRGRGSATPGTPSPRGGWSGRLGWLVRGTLVLAGLWLVATALLGRRPLPGDPVELTSPLTHGTWLVANGGSTGVVNAHSLTLDSARFADWRGQSYALDLVGAGAWGSRVRPVLDATLADFSIHGHPVLAPCDGRVVLTHDGEPERHDDAAPWASRPGNHVVLECGDAWVLLAHLSPGSVAVTSGSAVRVGDPIGRVGNTGASGEPHLHVHAQAPGTLDAPFAADPRPITLDGRRLVRNDRLHVPGTPSGAPATRENPR